VTHSIDIDKAYGGKAPWYIRTYFFCLIVGFFCYNAFIGYIPHWASTTEDSVNFVEFRLKGHRTYYLPSDLGWIANNGFWIFFFGIAALVPVVLLHAPHYRKRIRSKPEEGITP
jgi:hypothetical protein